MKASLSRLINSDQGTLGRLIAGEFSCYTLELPWRDNQRTISCIPLGEYETYPIPSVRYGIIYYVSNVTGREGILIHPGNLAGDVSMGYKTNVNGCILLGEKVGTLQGQLAVLLSRSAITRFMNYMNNEPFTLDIVGYLEEIA